jgi:cobalt-zinc-cadmium efflux system outer membrane protein
LRYSSPLASFCFLFAPFWLGTPTVWAQTTGVSTPSGAPLTVEEAVRGAVRGDPRYAASVVDVGAAQAGVRAARALVNPSLVLSPGITSVSGSSDELLFQQPLELGGTRSARTDIAKAQLLRQKAQTSAELRDLVFRTRSAYYELVRAREQSIVARDALAASQQFDQIARRQVDAGIRPGVDLAQTGIEVSRSRRLTILASAEEAVAAASLNTLMARLPDAPIGSVAIQALMPASPAAARPANEDVIEQALEERPEIEVERAEEARIRGEARLVRAEGRPDVAPQFRIGSFTRGLPNPNSGNGAGFGIGITLPLLDYGGRRDRIRQADASAFAQAKRIDAARNDIRREIVEARARLSAAEAVVREYQNGVLDQATRLLTGSRTGFEAGRTSVIGLLQAQRSYRAVQSEYVDAQVDAALARAAMARAVGDIAPNDLTPSTP